MSALDISTVQLDDGSWVVKVGRVIVFPPADLRALRTYQKGYHSSAEADARAAELKTDLDHAAHLAAMEEFGPEVTKTCRACGRYTDTLLCGECRKLRLRGWVR